MRDLAEFQDDVVGWIEDWTRENDGRTQRDYVLGSYIDSLITIGETRLQQRAKAGDERVIALLEDTNDAQRQTIYEHLAVRRDHRGAIPMGDEAYLHDERFADNPYVQSYLAMREALGEATYARHRDLINRLNLETFHALNGRELGQRGVADLIDRPAMEAFLDSQRPRMARWSELLDRISADRAAMLAANRFHTAAWYFDPHDDGQVEACLLAEYACTRDICRNDDTIETLHAWLEEHPVYDRPLFHTLTLEEQVALSNQLLGLVSNSYALAGQLPGIVENMGDWAERLQVLEDGLLPDLTQMPEPIQAANEMARANLSPALAKGIEQAMAPLGAVLEGNRLPLIEDLFEDLPRALGWRLMDAARQGGLSFVVSDGEAFKVFRDLVDDVFTLRRTLYSVNHQRARYRFDRGSEQYARLNQNEIHYRERLAPLEPRLAAALSPVEALPDERLDNTAPRAGVTAAAVRAGVTVAIAGNTQGSSLLQAGGFIRDLRRGLQATPSASHIGNALSLMIFLGQAINLWGVNQALDELPAKRHGDDTYELQKRKTREALAATAAAGFLGAQGIGHAALTARAAQLDKLLQHSGVDRVQAQLGRMHLGLGIVGYTAGFFAALSSLSNDFAKWQTAVRYGRSGAEAGALMAMGGSAGMAGVSGYALVTTGKTLIDVAFRGVTWTMAGKYLSQLFARFNTLGLAFSVLQLAGTWLHHRYNLSEHDRWLRSTLGRAVPGHLARHLYGTAAQRDSAGLCDPGQATVLAAYARHHPAQR
ncbi:hypothetical protein GCM10007160_14750 [Litchfieldella qijiaojingensis]|uniref:Uncharacterized protein n=2 Tax=Litchfieldella qijiaojingensis TaxID=980347 RepID=A0ABQ2YPQ1_9GAMM|nr:hypothetical protein GCM10007160_14750 [Halomonas qijiaojingensis]